jgi:hypothetical protein
MSDNRLNRRSSFVQFALFVSLITIVSLKGFLGKAGDSHDFFVLAKTGFIFCKIPKVFCGTG